VVTTGIFAGSIATLSNDFVIYAFKLPIYSMVPGILYFGGKHMRILSFWNVGIVSEVDTLTTSLPGLAINEASLATSHIAKIPIPMILNSIFKSFASPGKF